MKKQYTVEQIKQDDVDDVMRFLKRTFYLDEPLNAAVGLYSPDQGSCPELDQYCQESLLEGLSFKAVDAEGNVVGVMISGVCTLEEENNGNDRNSQVQKCQNTKFQKILYILARQEEGAKLWKRFPQDKQLVEVKVAATDPAWRRRGIMNSLLAETEKTTQQKGIRLLRMDTSSAYSAMSAERYGFTCVYKELYTDIKMDGQPIIVPAPPHVYDRVYIKKLFD